MGNHVIWRWVFAILLAALFPTAAFADTPATASQAVTSQPALMPIMQLTAQPVRFYDHNNAAGNLLLRELQRQSLLIAARDELGLRTRDMALGEPFTTHGKDNVTTVLMETRVWRTETAQSYIAQFDGDQPADPYDLANHEVDDPANKVVNLTSFKLTNDWWVDYQQFIEATAKQSQGEYVDILKKSGVLGDRAPAPILWTSGQPSKDAVQCLIPMNSFSQLLAVRLLHEQIRRDGASPERMDALVRGYSNLGLLTQALWSTCSKAYYARALLYAQRLVTHENSSAQSLYTRAYARAMAGFHAHALEDLAAAAAKDPKAVPSWKDAIEAFCRYDLHAAQLAEHSNPAIEPLAGLIEYIVAEDGYSSERYDAIALEYLKKHPDCFWLMARLIELQSVGKRESMPPMIAKNIPASLVNRLHALQLPEKFDQARSAIDADSDDYQATQVASFRNALEYLSKAGTDTAEPSLGALASLISDEEFFAAVQHALYQLDHLDPQTIKKDADETRPTWEGHPMGSFVDACTAMNQADLDNAFGRLRFTGGVFFNTEIETLPGDPNTRRTESRWQLSQASSDLAVLDWSVMAMRWMNATPSVSFADRWKFIDAMRNESPYSATLFRGWLEAYPDDLRDEDPALVQRTIDDATKRFDGKMRAMRVVSDWAVAVQDFPRALRLLTKIQNDDPSGTTGLSLMGCYCAMHDADNLSKVADQCLALPPSETSRSLIARIAAFDLMYLGQNDRALPYAQKAAESYSAAESGSLATCYQRLGQSDQALKVLHSMYQDDSPHWYIWANLAKDASLYDPAKASLIMDDGIADPMRDPAKALEFYQRQEGEFNHADSWVEYGIIAAEAGKPDVMAHAFDSAGGALQETDFGQRMAMLSRAKEPQWAIMEYEAWMACISGLDANCARFAQAGRLLAATGHKAEAVRFLKSALGYPAMTESSYYYAWSDLVKFGEDPTKFVNPQPTPAYDSSALVGTWNVTTFNFQSKWKFDADGTVELPGTPQIGKWIADGNHILIVWSASRWDTFNLPLNPSNTQGDSWKGMGLLHAFRDGATSQPTTVADALKPNTIDLLKLTDPAKRAINGEWRLVDGSLVSSTTPFARIEFPYEPPAEYDFRIVFTRLGGVDSIGQACSAGGHSFLWEMDGFNGTVSGFNQVNGKGEDTNPTGHKSPNLIAAGQCHTSIVKVRKDGVQAYLDGNLIAEWKTDYTDMGMDQGWKLHGDNTLGIGAWNSRIVFHAIDVTEVTGNGTILP